MSFTLSHIGQEAVSYASRYRWEVFPLMPRHKDNPLIKWGSGATSDPKLIAEMWTRWPQANIALATGKRSGVVIVDIDPRHDGDRTWAELQDIHGAAPDTLTSLSGRGDGGTHLYWQAPDIPLKSIAGALGQGVDCKAQGGYVVLPPSIHPSGGTYCWDTDGVAPAPAPAWLLALWPPAGHPSATESSNRPGAARLPATITEGQRNTLFTSLAGSMRRRGATEGAIIAALLELNTTCPTPLPEPELRKIATSISRYAPGRPPAKPGRAAQSLSTPLPKIKVVIFP